METDFFEADGEIVRLSQLEIEKVRDLVLMLDECKIPFASLVECRKMGTLETVVLNVEVEVPQLCRYPSVRQRELLRPFTRMIAPSQVCTHCEKTFHRFPISTFTFKNSREIFASTPNDIKKSNVVGHPHVSFIEFGIGLHSPREESSIRRINP